MKGLVLSLFIGVGLNVGAVSGATLSKSNVRADPDGFFVTPFTVTPNYSGFTTAIITRQSQGLKVSLEIYDNAAGYPVGTTLGTVLTAWTSGEKSYNINVNTIEGSGTFDITVTYPWDTTPPTTPQLSSIAAWINDRNPNMTWTVSTDYESDLSGYSYGLDSAPPAYVNTYATSQSLSNLSEGNHVFRVKAQNRAGLWSGTSSLSFGVDTVNPVTTLTNISGTLGDSGWYRSDVTVTVSATDSGSGVVMNLNDKLCEEVI